jgi:hypothetical protein
LFGVVFHVFSFSETLRIIHLKEEKILVCNVLSAGVILQISGENLGEQGGKKNTKFSDKRKVV